MRIFLRLTCLFLLAGLSAFAQERLSIDDAIVIGLKNNFGVRIAENELQAARNNTTAGNAGQLPRIDLAGDYTKGFSHATVKVATGGGLDLTDAESDVLNAGVVMRWTVFDGFNMFITLSKLKALEAAGEINARIAVENVLSRIITSYCDVIQQTRILGIIDERTEVSRFRAGLAETAFTTGSGSELELLKAKVDLNSDLAELAAQRITLAAAKANLNEVLARSPELGFSPDEAIPLLPALDYDELRRDAAARNHELLLAQRRRDIDSLEKGRTIAQLWPTLNLQASYNFVRSETEASFISFNQGYGPSIGVSASWNIFNGFNDGRKIENAKIDVMNDELRIRDLELRLQINLATVFGEYTNQLQQIIFERENLELAKKSMEIARESYSVGNSSSLELREVQRNLTAAGTRLVSAQYLAKARETELLRLAGRLVKYN